MTSSVDPSSRDVSSRAVYGAVQIKAAFERFPVSVKGAFVLRGADGSPHQVRLEAARVAELAGRGDLPIDIESSILEVAPTLDTFVPFEFPTMEMASGWYQLECDVVIDGTPATARPGKRFPVPWPRAAIRRGSVAIEKKVGPAKLMQLDCGGDSVKITYEGDEPMSLKITVDGAALTVLEHEHDDHTGTGKITAYPVLRTQERLAVQAAGASPVQVKLP